MTALSHALTSIALLLAVAAIVALLVIEYRERQRVLEPVRFFPLEADEDSADWGFDGEWTWPR